MDFKFDYRTRNYFKELVQAIKDLASAFREVASELRKMRPPEVTIDVEPENESNSIGSD